MTVSRARPRTAQGGEQAGDAHELSNYRLTERIGQDELSTIYRATHLTLDRPVQIQILRRTDWISSARFQLAGRLAARLHHPNILPVIDAGYDQRNGHYMVSPRLDGRSLEDILAGGPLEPMLALKVFSQIGAALDYLHEQQITHRDVRPANIILTQQGVAYLANFSLAAAQDTPDFSSLEETDYLTPYAAPEQTLRTATPSPSADLYSLGVTLYHMLLGDIPTQGQPLRSLTERDPELGSADRVIRRLLAPEVTQRFPNASLATAALRQAMRQQIDDATDDMEETHWEPVAEWLENPLEAVVGDLLDHEFIARSRARADGLHRVGAIQRLLDRWSRQGIMRRPGLGQIVQPEQIVSYNIYLYQLRAHYETRTALQSRERVHDGGMVDIFTKAVELWDAPVPELEPLEDAPAETLVLPGSQRVIPCTTCNGATQVPCKTCGGEGTLKRTRRVKESDGNQREETFAEECPTCRGYGRQTCPRCAGTGQMLEEKVFTWSRHGRLYLNEDDISGLHKLTIETIAQNQTVFSARIDPYEARWYQVAPLKELVEEAIKGGGPDSRLITSELVIRGVPVTEVDYHYKNKLHTLSLIGFEDSIRGDWELYDKERILLYAIIGALIVGLLIVLFFFR